MERYLLAWTYDRHEDGLVSMSKGDERSTGSFPPGVSVTAGGTVIESALKNLAGSPGVYRMINAAGDVLYVGKAKNLKKRVASYTHPLRLSNRLGRMIAETAAMEFVITHTEAEALLLEANLIKRFHPRYNILLRDDKSFPSILVSSDHPFPQVVKHRGAENRKGDYFGPFASVWAVNETLTVLQKAFLLRTCTDSVFSSRTRPCLLYQIKRCCAPCVGGIGETEYRFLVDQAHAFLAGESRKIQRNFAKRMQQASDALEFEKAAQYRDRIQALTRIQAHQDINLSGIGEADLLALYQTGGQTCIQVFFFRGGRNYGNRAYFPSHADDEGAAPVLEAFIGQFYAAKPPPEQVLVSHRLPNLELVAEALSVGAGRRIRVHRPQRGEKRKLMAHAEANARETLQRRLAESASQRRLLDGLSKALDLDGPPRRIEVFDNSHVSGKEAVGAMIVAGREGLIKKAYRKFTIGGGKGGEDMVCFSPGDDYAMLGEVLTRRFSRALKEDPDRAGEQWPDLVLIDGGGGHLGTALEVFRELGIEDIAVAAIAKGADRNAGGERIHLPGREPLILKTRDPVLFFLQRLRDEAHRFAIGAHRAKRTKTLFRSTVDGIPGIGPKRKRALLHHFGSARAIAAAGRTDLETVDGISRAMANKIYDWFHAAS